MTNPFETLNARLAALEALTIEALEYLRSVPQPVQVGGIELAQSVTGLSKSRLYALVSNRQVPHKKRGNKLYFNRAELLAWVEEGHRCG